MVKKVIRLIFISSTLFCTFQLGKIDARTKHFKRVVECVDGRDIEMPRFYGHKTTEGYIFNHAHALSSHLYLRCIYKDLYE